MALQLTNKRKKWFTVKQDPTGETQVEIVHLKPGEVAEIESRANSIAGKQTGDDDFYTEISFNFPKRDKQYAIACIVDWKGFVNAKGQPLKCNEKGILAVWNEYDWFAKFIEECRNELREEVETELEGAEGN